MRLAAASVLVALVLAALVLVVYVSILAGTTLLLGGTLALGRSGVVPVVVATVVVALVVQPMYSAVLRWSRGVCGVAATDPFNLLRRLPRSVTGELPAEDVPRHMVRVLAEGLRTSQCELWLRMPSGDRLAASWPPLEPAANGRDLEAGPFAGERRQPVVHGGEAIGLLRVCHQPPRDLSRLERRLLDAYAAQSGQVVRMLTLRAALQDRRAELAARSEALREVNAQLVEARALERRLLERDLHDGGQQQLLVVALGVELARQQSVRDRPTARSTVERVQLTADQARVSLLGLADGLAPRILASEGLAAALRSALSGAVVPVLVRAAEGDEALGRRPLMPPAVAEALFYVAAEATQNATKHAGSSHVTVDVGALAAGWSVVVSDRGRGFDPLAADQGSGLAGMRGRLEALGGRLDVRSAPGSGTRVAARVPWPHADEEGPSAARGSG